MARNQSEVVISDVSQSMYVVYNQITGERQLNTYNKFAEYYGHETLDAAINGDVDYLKVSIPSEQFVQYFRKTGIRS